MNWKSRYAELVAQQERHQDRNKKKSALLLSALSSLAVLAKGVDQGATEKALAMQALLRREKLKNSEFEPLVSALSKQAERSLTAREKAIKKVLADLGTIAADTQKVSQQASEVDALKLYRKNLKRNKTSYADLGQLVAMLTSLHTSALKNISKPVRSGFLSWFSAEDESEERGDKADSNCPVVVDPELAETMPNSDELDDEALLLSATEQLLRSLDVPRAQQGELEAIKIGLVKARTVDDFPPILESICALLERIGRLRHEEFEKFLSELNTQLKSLTASLNSSKILHDSNVDTGRLLDEDMHEHIGRLRSQVQSVSDIDTLKSEVNVNMDAMASLMNTHKIQADQQQQDLTLALGEMAAHIQSMEAEAQEAEAEIKAIRLLAMTDSLTQLPNREAYKQRAAQEISRWQRYERPLCLAVCDIDLFKRVNDDFGHAAGDFVLQEIAQLLVKRLRESDFICRFGGEEFVVLLPESDPEQALRVMDSLRMAVSESQFIFEDVSLKTSISIGIVAFAAMDNLESAFTRADRALYEAKAAGRNRCLVASNVNLGA